MGSHNQERAGHFNLQGQRGAHLPTNGEFLCLPCSLYSARNGFLGVSPAAFLLVMRYIHHKWRHGAPFHLCWSQFGGTGSVGMRGERGDFSRVGLRGRMNSRESRPTRVGWLCRLSENHRTIDGSGLVRSQRIAPSFEPPSNSDPPRLPEARPRGHLLAYPLPPRRAVLGRRGGRRPETVLRAEAHRQVQPHPLPEGRQEVIVHVEPLSRRCRPQRGRY